MQSDDSRKSDVWAKLVSLGLSLSSTNKTLIDDSYTVGMAASNDIQVSGPRIDDAHFRIYRETKEAGDCYWIENLSPSGTVVEDTIIKERNKLQLTSGDRIGYFYPNEMESEVVLAYVFCSTAKESNKRKRNLEKKRQGEKWECEKQKRFYDELKNHLECNICLSLIYNCVTVLPCLHNFCASCISEGIRVRGMSIL